MGVGADCPLHLVRYSTGASIAKLAGRFHLAFEPRMQDWEIEVAEFTRAEELLGAYDDPEFTEDDRFVLMALVVASLDEGVQAGAELGTLWPRTRRLLRRDARLHAPTLSYWARGNDDDS